MKDLKEIHDKPNENFGTDLATGDEKTRCIKLYELLALLMRGRALQLAKAVEDSNGLDAWSSLNKDLKPISKARGLALLGAAIAWSTFFNEQCSITSTYLMRRSNKENTSRKVALYGIP